MGDDSSCIECLFTNNKYELLTYSEYSIIIKSIITYCYS